MKAEQIINAEIGKNVVKEDLDYFVSIYAKGPLRIKLIPLLKKDEKVYIEYSSQDAFSFFNYSKKEILYLTHNERSGRVPEIRIYYRVIRKITANLSCNIISEYPLKNECLEIMATHSSKIDLEVDVKKLVLTVEDGASLICRGVADALELSVDEHSFYAIDSLKTESRKLEINSYLKMMKQFLKKQWIKLVLWKRKIFLFARQSYEDALSLEKLIEDE